MKAITCAAFAAIAVQPCVFLLTFWLSLLVQGGSAGVREATGMALMAGVIAIPFVALIGVPAFLLLRHLGRLSHATLGAVGLVGAVLPFALYGWPLGVHYIGYSSAANWAGRRVDLYVSGAPTMYAWAGYVHGLALFGLQGVAGAAAFLLVWRRVAATPVRVRAS